MSPELVEPVDVAHRDLVELSARFAREFLRWLDATSGGGLTYPRLRVLETLHCQGPAKMRSLAETLNLSPRNVTALADSLESDGLVKRRDHPTDRRVTILELTDVGRVAAEDSLTPRLTEMSRLFDELTPTMRARFRSTLETLVGVMETSQGCDGAA
jgi:DNA-binding MarR family transcriptional regulator